MHIHVYRKTNHNFHLSIYKFEIQNIFVNFKFHLLNSKYNPLKILIYKMKSPKQNLNKCETRILATRKCQNLPFLAYSGPSDGILEIREF